MQCDMSLCCFWALGGLSGGVGYVQAACEFSALAWPLCVMCRPADEGGGSGGKKGCPPTDHGVGSRRGLPAVEILPFCCGMSQVFASHQLFGCVTHGLAVCSMCAVLSVCATFRQKHIGSGTLGDKCFCVAIA